MAEGGRLHACASRDAAGPLPTLPPQAGEELNFSSQPMSAGSDLTSVKPFANRLALRAFTPADAPEIFAAVSPTITRFMAWDPLPSPAAFAEVWRQWLPRMTAGTDLSLVIRLRATDEFLGVAGIHGIGSAEPAARNRKLEFGSRNPPIASAMAEKPSEQS
jgi:hypothetical protein